MDPGVSPQTPQSKRRPAGFPCVASICEYQHPMKSTVSDHQASKANQCRRITNPNILILLPGKLFVPPTLAPKVIKSTSCLSNYGVDYTGDLNVTREGHTCLPWSSSEAEALSKNKEFVPEVSLAGNKCRNPDKDPEGPWCYVQNLDHVTIDYCNLELCGKYGLTTESRSTAAVFQTRFGLNYPSLFTSNTEEFLSEDLPSDTGAQQRTTLSSRQLFFNPRTFGQGEDGKPLSNFML